VLQALECLGRLFITPAEGRGKEREGGKGGKENIFRPSAQIAHTPRVLHDPPSGTWLSTAGPPKGGKKKEGKKKKEGSGDERSVCQIGIDNIRFGQKADGKKEKGKGKKISIMQPPLLYCGQSLIAPSQAALGCWVRGRERTTKGRKKEGGKSGMHFRGAFKCFAGECPEQNRARDERERGKKERDSAFGGLLFC